MIFPDTSLRHNCLSIRCHDFSIDGPQVSKRRHVIHIARCGLLIVSQLINLPRVIFFTRNASYVLPVIFLFNSIVVASSETTKICKIDYTCSSKFYVIHDGIILLTEVPNQLGQKINTRNLLSHAFCFWRSKKILSGTCNDSVNLLSC